MSNLQSHFWKGNIPVAFMFSAPGNKEATAGRPVSGETGRNLDDALAYLHTHAPDIFSSVCRYDYRITNAFCKPLAKNIANGRTEASKLEILAEKNIKRLIAEITDCRFVVLCGKKASYTSSVISDNNIYVVHAVHLGNKGLNQKFKLPNNWKATTSDKRRQERIRLWADGLLKEISQLECLTA